MSLGHDHSHSLARRLFDFMGWIFDRRSFGSFPAEVSHSSSPNSLLAHSHQNQHCALAWGSYTDYHCSEVLGLCLALKFSFATRACGNAGSPTYGILQTVHRAPALFWAAP
jgi:hypothetical protein